MQINTKINSTGIGSLAPARRSAPAASASADGVSFASTTALESALKNTPAVRPEAVGRARELISDPSYPPASTVKRLADFFAGKLSSDNE